MTICKECDWYYVVNDENGIVDYCMRRNICGDLLQKITSCDYFQNKYDHRLKDGGDKNSF